MSKKAHLCVGGPKAGQRIAVKEDVKYLRIPVIKPRLSETGVTTIDYVEYREQVFPLGQFSGEQLTVWVPVDQDHGETLSLLMTAYERGCK